jgi:hypothetical protein
MLGVLGGLALPSNTDWGEQMLNTVLTQAIKHLFSHSDAVEVNVRCFPASKILQGCIDGFKMVGRGMVIQREFQVEEMSFETDAVTIDVKSILSGAVRLQAPTQAVAQVKLSEKGINEAFQADLVRKRLINLELAALAEISGGKPISFRDIRLSLLPNNQVRIWAKAEMQGAPAVPVSLTADLTIERRRRICFQNPTFFADPVPEDQRPRSQAFSEALGDILNDMVDLDRFNLDGITLRLNRLETQDKMLLFSGYAQIQHFPGTG